MMNQLILGETVQRFLKENPHTNFRELSLKKQLFENISSSELAQQLKGMQIAKNKFRFLYESDKIYYPPSLNLEQASSQATAEYKASLLKGKLLADLTAGMGIDAFFFARNFEKVIAVERNLELSEISKHNYKILKAGNIEYIHSNFEDFLAENPNLTADVIFLDPSRRNASGRKFLIGELEPNLYEWANKFLKISERLMVKLSPMFDLKELTGHFDRIAEIHLIAVRNEMKELLLIFEQNHSAEPKITAVNLESGQAAFEFNFEDEKNAQSTYSEPLKYIYEPNPAVMKSGAFKLCSQKFGLKKLEINTHLYTSDGLNTDFPGKIFEVKETIRHPKKEITGKAFHVITRNYPLTADEVRKRFKLKQSDEETLIFCNCSSGKKILRCKRFRAVEA